MRCAFEMREIVPGLYFGAEGDGGTGDAGTGQEPTGTVVPPVVPPVTPPVVKDPETFDLAYVKSLRDENAAHRTKNKSLEGELATHAAADKKRSEAEMSDLEKANSQLADEKAKSATAIAGWKEANMNAAVATAAGKLNFRDPSDALNAIDTSEIDFNEQGIPDSKAIERQLKAIAKDKAYLLKDGKEVIDAGDGDGGGKRPADSPDEFQADVDKYTKEFKAQGLVPIPQ